MSYERNMLENMNMPSRKEVELALLKSLFKHNGVIKEFGAGEEIVDEIADDFDLNEEQRTAYLKTIYKKENREKKSYLWHRLLFRAADSLAREKLVSRPTQTFLLTNKKEWMLTEFGYDRILRILKIPLTQKEILSTKSYEVQKIVKEICETKRLENYNPFEIHKKVATTTQGIKLRKRAFRHAIIEAYDFKCAVCGIKIFAPRTLQWEVEAAHIVPHSANGKDDILNGLALCHLHHWAFDVGLFTMESTYKIIVSKRIRDLSNDYGRMWDYNFMGKASKKDRMISLPKDQNNHPHYNSIKWHRENIFIP